MPAGYPSARALLDALRGFAHETLFLQASEAWQEYERGLALLPEEMRLVVNNRNPEIALTLLDLFAAAAEQEDEAVTGEAVRQWRDTGVADDTRIREHFESPSRELASGVRVALARLRTCLEWWFLHAHLRDAHTPRESRDYLRTELNKLAPGDVVLTLNWDSLAERTLAEDGRWQPGDGYGFTTVLQARDRLGGYHELPARCLAPSEVRVLKLHGSYGWRLRDEGKLPYLDSERFLNAFPLYCDGRSIHLRDVRAPESEVDPVAMAYPSYMKGLPLKALLPVWVAATDALASARQVDVWGYSLPLDDAAVRALLLPLRRGLAAGSCSVDVHDPSAASRRRWTDLLGEGVRTHDQRLA